MRRPGSLLGIACVAAVIGCSNGSNGPNDTEKSNPLATGLCTQVLLPAVTVEVRDMVTGAPAACGTTGEVRDGDYVAPLTDSGSCATAPDTTVYLQGPWERSGNYTVTIVKPGYRDWVRRDVVVMSDHCHVQTVSLQALLEPS